MEGEYDFAAAEAAFNAITSATITEEPVDIDYIEIPDVPTEDFIDTLLGERVFDLTGSTGSVDFQRVEELLDVVWPGQWGRIITINEQSRRDSSNWGEIDNVISHGGRAYHIDFDEIEITNNVRHVHIIRGLSAVILFNIENGQVKMHPTLMGFRTVQTAVEYSSSYSHSHLPSLTQGNPSGFCLGGGTEMAMMSIDLNQNFDYQTFEVFLYMIGHYVRYESIEGGPYKRMAQIGFMSGSSGSHNINTSSLHSFTANFCSNLRLSQTFRSIIHDNMFNGAHIEYNDSGYNVRLNLRSNLIVLQELVSCLPSGGTNNRVAYNEGNFTPRDSGERREKYTPTYCSRVNRELFTSMVHGKTKSVNYTLLPEIGIENVEDYIVPNLGFIKSLEARLENTYKMHLNIKQNY